MRYGALVTLRRGSRCASNSGWDGDTCIMACALRYVGYGAGRDVRVTLCGLRCAGTVCVSVCREGGVTTWVTLCGWWCHGHDVWITLRGKHYVADVVQITLRGSWCVSIHTRVKTQFRRT